MFLTREWKALAAIIGVFLLAFFLSVGWERFDNAVLESFQLVKWYAREHVILCLIPAAILALVFSHEPTMAFLAGVTGLSILISGRKEELGDLVRVGDLPSRHCRYCCLE